jgi:CheY-like chemotaxis protein
MKESTPLREGSTTDGATTPSRVLIVDDNTDAVEMLAGYVQLVGHDVAIADCGASALEVARSFVPDVALLDIGLPDVDGWELASRIRALPGLAKTRLIAVTGYGQRADRERSQRAGFEAHLTKPADLALVERLLQRADL